MSEYTDYLKEVLAPFAAIEARRMFGGYGLYRDGLMFALVIGEVLYLKTDAESAAAFEARGLEPFRYARGGRLVALSFHEAPAEIFEDPGEAREWASRAWAAALRSAARRRKPARTGKRSKPARKAPGRSK